MRFKVRPSGFRVPPRPHSSAAETHFFSLENTLLGHRIKLSREVRVSQAMPILCHAGQDLALTFWRVKEPLVNQAK
jgi:hypothetical protein